MKPYWAGIDLPGILGVGVTAVSEDDARSLIRSAFPGATVTEIRTISDIGELDQNHVVPNMSPHWLQEGIWFPRGFENLLK